MVCCCCQPEGNNNNKNKIRKCPDPWFPREAKERLFPSVGPSPGKMDDKNESDGSQGNVTNEAEETPRCGISVRQCFNNLNIA